MQKYLKFQLDEKDRGLLVAESVKEAIAISISDILPLPEVPDYIVGIYSWRGEIVTTIDLPHLLGYPSAIDAESTLCPRDLTAAIVQNKANKLALIVSAIDEIVDRDLILLKHNVTEVFSPSQAAYLSGYFAEVDTTCWYAIDIDAIVAKVSN